MSPISWPFRQRRQQREPDEPLAVLAGYGAPNVLQRNRRKLTAIFFLLMLIYTLAFIVIGRFLFVQFLIPIALLIFLCIWALPETGRPPLRLLTRLFFAFLVFHVLWPDYFALALPGLPWITMLRLTTGPMAFVFLIALSVSADFRAAMKAMLGDAKAVVRLIAVFSVLAALSILLSDAVVHTLNRVINMLFGWTVVFFASCFVFSRHGNAERAAAILWGAAVLWLLVGVWEWRLEHVPWAGHIPSFLAADDEAMQRVLEGSRRYGGQYRIQAKFFTPISFAEFLALVSPFVLHWTMTARKAWVRIAAGITLPLIFLAIIGTDSRLGAAGFLMTFMIYMFFWGVRRWRFIKESIIGPAIVIGYPVAFAVFLAATLFIGRLRKMVWGGGAHVASNQAREEQWEMGIPLITQRPWGHGVGMSGYVLGYTAPDGTLSVDSYYLTMLLDLGVVGFAVFFGMFLFGIYLGGRRAIGAPDGEALWIVPAVIALVNFVIIKAVLSQVESHPLAFVLLGMVVALGWRIRQQAEAAGPRFPLEAGRPAPLHSRIGHG